MRHLTTTDIEVQFRGIQKDADVIQGWWRELLPQLVEPAPAQFLIWAKIHGGSLGDLRLALEKAALRARVQPFNDSQHPIMWISKTANGQAKERLGIGRAA